MVERRLCITRRRSTRSAAYRASVGGILLPAVRDQIFVDNRDYYNHLHCCHPVKKGTTVLHIILTGRPLWRVLLTHLFSRLFLFFFYATMIVANKGLHIAVDTLQFHLSCYC